MDEQRTERDGGRMVEKAVAPFHEYVDGQWNLYTQRVLSQSELAHHVIDTTWERGLGPVMAFSELPNEVREVMWDYFTRLNSSTLGLEPTSDYDKYFKSSVLAILEQRQFPTS